MKNATPWTMERLAALAAAVERAVQSAVRQTLIEHKQSGDPVVYCDGGEIRWVPAAEIEIPALLDEQ